MKGRAAGAVAEPDTAARFAPRRNLKSKLRNLAFQKAEL